MLGDGQVLRLDARTWALPPVFAWLGRAGRLDAMELLRTFNCGIGMILVVDPGRADAVRRGARRRRRDRRTRSARIAAASGRPRVEFAGLETHGPPPRRRPDLGRRLQPSGADRRHRRGPAPAPTIALVISNRADAFGLTRARDAGIPTLSSTIAQSRDRAAFEARLDRGA